jgi:hypothetical protein
MAFMLMFYDILFFYVNDANRAAIGGFSGRILSIRRYFIHIDLSQAVICHSENLGAGAGAKAAGNASVSVNPSFHNNYSSPLYFYTMSVCPS